MNEGAIWTDRNVATLRQMWAERASASEIAAALGMDVTRNAVIGKVHRLKLPKRPTPVATNAIPEPKPKPKPKPTVRAKPVYRPPPRPEIPIEPTRIKAEAWQPLPGTVPVTMDDLERGQCRWPLGTELPFLFCGCEALPDRPYCEAHTRRASGPPQPKLKAPGKW